MDSSREAPVKLRPEVLQITAYRQGVTAPKDGFKLSSNENPYGPLPSVLKRVTEASDFNRYADASMLPLRTALAEKFGVRLNEVHVAAGSVSILYQLIHAAAGLGDEYIHAWPSFEAYPGLGIAAGSVAKPISLTPDQKHDLSAMANAVTDKTRAIILCSPNNPTGPVITADEFATFMAQVPKNVLVILDEAYREFITTDDAVFGEQVIAQYPQLVLLRTFSKAYGLAGLRIGYAIGNETILNAARAVSIPLSVTATAHAGAVASLEAEEELMQRIRLIAADREALLASLRALGYQVADSQGNFVFVVLGDRAGAFADFFAEEGVVVRPFLGHGVRISVGEPESIPRVIELASRFMSQDPSRREEVR